MLSKAQREALRRISTPPTGPSPYHYEVKERTAESLLKMGFVQKVGERISLTTCCTLIECIITETGRKALSEGL